MESTESTKEIAAALAKAQTQFKQITRDKTVTVRTRSGTGYTFNYAPLESIMASIKAPLAENGIALLQSVIDGKVQTVLMHTSGERIVSGGTQIRATEDSAQAYGSGLTYARRYDLSLLLGICPDDDDDGNAADGNSVGNAALKGPITPTDSAWDCVPADKHEPLHRIGSCVIDYFASGDIESAYKYWVGQKLTNDEKTAVWTMFDSKQRRALKDRDQQPKSTEVKRAI